jgi:hypothetical protein
MTSIYAMNDWMEGTSTALETKKFTSFWKIDRGHFDMCDLDQCSSGERLLAMTTVMSLTSYAIVSS